MAFHLNNKNLMKTSLMAIEMVTTYLDESGGSPEDDFGSGDARRRREGGGDFEDRLDPELDLERRRR